MGYKYVVNRKSISFQMRYMFLKSKVIEVDMLEQRYNSTFCAWNQMVWEVFKGEMCYKL